MGGDMAVAYFTLPKGEDPEAGKQRIIDAVSSLGEEALDELLWDALESIADSYVMDEEEDEVPPEEAKRIILRVVEEGFNRIPFRDVAHLTIGDREVYLTGGLTWGDSPTDSYDPFQRLGEVIWKLEQVKT